MIVVFVMAAVLWGMGAVLKTPHQARWIMIGLLFVGVLTVHLVLPDGHPLREGLGGSPALWVMLGVFAGLGFFYRKGLMWIRARTNPVAFDPPATGKQFADVELERYARHIVLREVGGQGQKALKGAKILVVGAGGLGSPAMLYLAASGVGTIGVIDDDVVENTNLQRQIIHTDGRIGMPKVFSAEAAMKAQNPFVAVRPFNRRLTPEIAEDLFQEFDVILDGSDNFDTRYLVNETCVALNKPLVAAALTQWEGQISVYRGTGDVPCYACTFPKAPDAALAPSCAEAGVFSPITGVLGSMMAVEAMKLVVDAGAALEGEMLIYDALYAETRKIKLKRDPNCAVCGG